MPSNCLKKRVFRAVFFASILLVFHPCERASSSDWATYLYDGGRTNSSPEDISLPLKQVWNKKLSPYLSSYSTESMSSPVIYNGVLYVGSSDGRFYAFDLSSRKRLWKFKADSSVEGPATADPKNVYFGSVGGILYSLDRDTGAILWQFNSKGEIHSSPAISGQFVYLHSSDNRIYAIKKDTGEGVWTYAYTSSRYVSALFYNSPSVSEERIFTLFPDGTLVALDLLTGKELWKKKVLTEDMPSTFARRTPLVYEGLVYVINSNGALLSFDEKTGEDAVRYDLFDTIDFVVSDKDIYLLSKERLIALRRGTGEILWAKRLAGGEPRLMFSTPRHLFVLSNKVVPFDLGITTLKLFDMTHGYIEAFNRESGKVSWNKKLASKVGPGAPSFSQNKIAILTPSGSLSVLSPD